MGTWRDDFFRLATFKAVNPSCPLNSLAFSVSNCTSRPGHTGARRATNCKRRLLGETRRSDRGDRDVDRQTNAVVRADDIEHALPDRRERVADVGWDPIR